MSGGSSVVERNILAGGSTGSIQLLRPEGVANRCQVLVNLSLAAANCAGRSAIPIVAYAPDP